jgi:hypothetical protein
MCFITPSSHQGGVINATMRYARPQLELISQLNSDLRRACSARSTPRLSAELTATNHMFCAMRKYEHVIPRYLSAPCTLFTSTYVSTSGYIHAPYSLLFFPTTIYTSLWNDLLSITRRSRRQSTMGASTRILVNERSPLAVRRYRLAFHISFFWKIERLLYTRWVFAVD